MLLRLLRGKAVYAVTTVARFNTSGSIVTPKPGPLGIFITPFTLLSEDVAHSTGTVSPSPTPLPPPISIQSAANYFQAAQERFAVEIPRADIQEFFDLPGFEKLRVHYAWSTLDPNTRVSTFLLMGAAEGGAPISGHYLLPARMPVAAL